MTINSLPDRPHELSYEALLELNRHKDAFFAVLGHELRNPLPAIHNAVRLLRHEASDTVVRQKAVAIVDRQVKQLTLLIDNVLEMARATTGRVHLRRERMDLRDVMGNAVETIRPLVERRKHSLSVSLPLEPVWLDADASRIEQVVVNLLTNAAKYTLEDGQISIELQSEGHDVVMLVRDTGIGISPEMLPHVFDLFIQSEESLLHSEGGLGIGLALVRRLVEMHGGTVTASSPGPGRGSEFVVRLPASTLQTRRENAEERHRAEKRKDHVPWVER